MTGTYGIFTRALVYIPVLCQGSMILAGSVMTTEKNEVVDESAGRTVVLEHPAAPRPELKIRRMQISQDLLLCHK